MSLEIDKTVCYYYTRKAFKEKSLALAIVRTGSLAFLYTLILKGGNLLSVITLLALFIGET